MAGAWAETMSVTSLEREGLDIFPAPGPFSFVGRAVFDAEGKAITVSHTNISPDGVARPELTDFFDGKVTIQPDCTGTTVYTLRHDLPADHPFYTVFGLEGGQVIIAGDFVCAHGQQECTGVTTVPSFQVGVITWRRIAPAVDKIKEKVDRLLGRFGLPKEVPPRFE
jgi:hypothetical protein